jgi:hypothetical protein
MLSLSGRPNLSPMMQDYIIATKNALVISHMLKSFYDLRQGLDHSIIMEIIGIYYKNTEIMDLLFKIYADCSYYILKQMVPSIRSFHAQQAIIQRFVELEPHKIVYYQVVKSSHSFDFYISDHLQQQLSAMVRVASLANNHLDEQYMLSLLENGDLYSFIYAVAHNTESSIHAVREVICQDFGSSYSRELLKKAGISASGLAFVKRVITTLYKHVVQQYLDHQLLSEILKF